MQCVVIISKKKSEFKRSRHMHVHLFKSEEYHWTVIKKPDCNRLLIINDKIKSRVLESPVNVHAWLIVLDH